MLYKKKYLTNLIAFDLQKIQWTLSPEHPSISVNVSMNKAETAIDTVASGAGSPRYHLVRVVELSINQDADEVAADTYHLLSVQNIKDKKASEIKYSLGGISVDAFEEAKIDAILAYKAIGLFSLQEQFENHLSKDELCEFIMDEISRSVPDVYLKASSVRNGILRLFIGVVNDLQDREIELELPFSINFKSNAVDT